MLIKLSTDKMVSETAAALHVAQRSGFASNLAKFGKLVKRQEAENHITMLMRPSLLVLDICDQNFFCQMAKKLGCQFFAKKKLELVSY